MRTEQSIYQPRVSEAFPFENLRGLSPEAVFEHARTYLGEYRINLSIDEVTLFFDGELRGEHEKEPLTTQIRRYIDIKSQQGKPIHRESADLAGALRLEHQLAVANHGDVVLWAYPPETGSRQYGDHGFINIGRVRTDNTGTHKHVDMHIYRIESSRLEAYNQALSRLTGEYIDFLQPEEFIANTFLIPDLAEADVLKVLAQTCGFAYDVQEPEMKEQLFDALAPYIGEFISHIKQKTSHVQKIWDALQNYTVETWESLRFTRSLSNRIPFDHFVSFYGQYSPPVAMGSCGESGSSTSNFDGNILTKYTIKDMNSSGEKKLMCVTCPFCGKKVNAVIKDGRIYCPRDKGCGKSAKYPKQCK